MDGRSFSNDSVWLNADSSVHIPNSPSLSPVDKGTRQSFSSKVSSSAAASTSKPPSVVGRSGAPSRQPSPVARKGSIPVISTTNRPAPTPRPNPFARRLTSGSTTAAKPAASTAPSPSTVVAEKKREVVRPPLAPQPQATAPTTSAAPVAKPPVRTVSPPPVAADVEEEQPLYRASLSKKSQTPEVTTTRMTGFTGTDGDSMFLDNSIHIPDPVPEGPNNMDLELKALRDENQKLRQSVSPTPGPATATATTDVAAVEKKLADTMALLADVQHEKHQWKTTQQQMEADLAAAKGQLATEKFATNSWREKAEKESAKLASEMSRLQTEAEVLAQQHAASKKQLQAQLEAALANNTAADNDLITAELEAAQQALRSVEKQLGEKDVQLDFANSEAETAKSEMFKFKEEVDGLRFANADAQSRMERLQQDMQTAQANSTTVADERVAEAHRAFNEEREVLKGEVEDAQKAAADATAAIRVAQEAAEKTLEETKTQFHEAMDEATADAETKIAALHKDNNDLSEKCTMLTAQLDEANVVLAAAQDEIKEKAAAIAAELEQQLDALKEDLATKEALIAESEQQMELLQKQHKETIEETVNDHCRHMNAIRQELDECRIDNADLNNKLNVRAGSANDAKQALRETNEELLATKQALASLEAERGSLDGRIRTLERQLDAATKHNNDITKEEKEKYERRIESLNDELARAERHHEAAAQEAETELEQLRTSLDASKLQLTEQRAHWNRDKMQLMTSESEARNKMAELNRALDAATTSTSADNKKVAQLEDQLREAIETKADIRKRYDSVFEQLESERGQTTAQQRELEELRTKVSTLENVMIKSQQERRIAAASPTPMRPRGALGRAAGEMTPLANSVTRKTSRQAMEQAGALQESSVNRVPSTAELPMKRYKPLCMHRRFTLTGFRDTEKTVKNIQNLTGASYVECSSNKPVDKDVTHCVSNGNLTLKLLTAATNGCWILPESYIEASNAKGEWLDESTFEGAHRHLVNPLAGKTIGYTDSFRQSSKFSTIQVVTKHSHVHESTNLSECDIILHTNADRTHALPSGPSALRFDQFINDVILFRGVKA